MTITRGECQDLYFFSYCSLKGNLKKSLSYSNVDSQKEYQRMVQMDVNGVITGDPVTVPKLGSVIRTEEC